MSMTEFESRLATLEKEVASLKEQLEYIRTLTSVRQSLDDADKGRGTPLKQVDKQLRAKYSL